MALFFGWRSGLELEAHNFCDYDEWFYIPELTLSKVPFGIKLDG